MDLKSKDPPLILSDYLEKLAYNTTFMFDFFKKQLLILI